VASILEDWRTAPINEKLRATLGFLEKLTISPGEVTSEDIQPLIFAGVTDRAIEQAIYVCFLFNMMDRLADAFDFYLPSPQGFRQDARLLYNLGYWSASIPG
jgi:alkylhydroperoxidase family enzyme